MFSNFFLARVALVVTLLIPLPLLSASYQPRYLSYDRWVPAQPLSQSERALFRSIKRWGREHEQAIQYDTRLARAAAGLISAKPPKSGRIDLTYARNLLWRYGHTDAGIAAIHIQLPQNAKAMARLTQELSQIAATLPFNRVGLSANKNRAVILVSRHMLSLLPMAARGKPHDILHIHGRLLSDAAASVQLSLTYPEGTSHSVTLPVDHGQFEQAIQLGTTPGVLRAQLLVDIGRGPETAALLPIAVGPVAPYSDTTTAMSVDPQNDTVASEQELLDLFLGARKGYGLELPHNDMDLTRIARAHSQDMADHHFFAHASPTHGDAAQRLRQAHVGFSKVLENLGQAPSVDQIFEQWLQSPAHRQNLFDSGMTHVGIGIVGVNHHDMIATLLMVQRTNSKQASATNSAELLEQIDAYRKLQHINALRPQTQLTRMAESVAEQCSILAARDCLQMHEYVIDDVLRDTPMDSVAVDIFASDNALSFEQSKNVAGDFSYIGIGIASAAPDLGPARRVVIIYGK